MISISSAFLAATLLTAAPLTMYGDIISSWSHMEHGSYTKSQNDGISLDQVDLGVYSHLNDWIDIQTRLTFTGNSVSLSEGILRFNGLPLEGNVTIGRFYKPGGAPIPLATLSMPAILLHGAPEYGIKLNAALRPFDFELGIVNGNPFLNRDYSSAIANSAALSTGNSPNTLEVDKTKDYYGRIAYSSGEDWGSLTTGVTYTEGTLSNFELNFLNPGRPGDLKLFPARDFRDRRHHLTFDLDFQKGPWRLFSEYANAQDGRLRRKIWAIAGSWTFYPRWGAMTATIAYDRLRHNAEIIEHRNSLSWPRDRTSLALAWQPNEILQWQAQYDFNLENVRDPMGRKVDNDALRIQSILYF